jgi:hypothetical protein
MFVADSLEGYRKIVPATASVGGVKYATFAEALGAQREEAITLLDDVTIESVVDIGSRTLVLNGHAFKTLAFYGRLSMTGGKLETYDTNSKSYFFMAAPEQTSGALYWSSDAVMTINKTNYDIVLESGSVTLPNSWRTLVGQRLVINEGATFIFPENVSLNLRGNAVVAEGATLTCAGAVLLGNNLDEVDVTATLKAQEGLNVISAVEGYEVTYVDGVYSLALAKTKWDDVINGNIASDDTIDKVKVEEKLEILASILKSDDSKDVSSWIAKVYGENNKVPLQNLLAATESLLGISVAYDLPILTEIPQIKVKGTPASENAKSAFEFSLSGVTIAGGAEKAKKLVKHTHSLDVAFKQFDAADMDNPIDVTIVNGALRVEFVGSAPSAFAKVDFE